jgi:hypothetical protein
MIVVEFLGVVGEFLLPNEHPKHLLCLISDISNFRHPKMSLLI